LAGPTTKAAKEMEGLGIGQAEIPGITAATSTSLKALGLHASEVADTLSKQGLPAALAMITDALAKKFPPGSAAYEAALKGAVGGTRGLTAALELTGPSAATFAKNVESIGGATAKGGASVTGFARTQQDLGAQVDKAKAGLAAFGIHIGQVLLPVVTTLVQFFNEHVLPAFNTVFSTIQQHVPQIEAGFHNFGNAVNVVFTVAGNIITTVVGVIIAIIERVVVVIQAIVGPIQATVIRIGVIIGWIVTAVQGVINIVSGPVGTAFSLMSTAIGGVIGGIVAAIGKIVGAINGVITAIQTAIGWFTKLFQTASSQTTSTLTDAWNKANPGRPLPPNLQALVNATGHHASGGTIAAGAWG
ncbi:MAG: hypothetical protein ACRDZY_18845, partial [Acidimicrobiales bacterium]